MKSLRSLYLFAALLVSGIASAQESDDLYFSVKDRDQEMVAKRQSNAKLNAMTIRDNMQDQTMRSKFSNPDFQQNANQSVARMPYFKKDYRRDYSFNSLYANNAATNRWGVMNNSWFSPAMSMGMMFGNSMMGNSMWRNPYMMNSMMGNSMMYDPYMMNSMAFGNPYSMMGMGGMMGMGFGNPYMMGMGGFGNPYMMYDPYMMGFGNPYSMMSPWGMNSGFGMGMGWNSFGMGFGNPYMMRNSFLTPIVYNSIVSSVGSSSLNNNNSVTYPTSGSDYASYMRTASDYGTYANSSVGNGTNYNAVEYKGGTANSYFYGTPADNGGSNWGTRSVDYNNGGSYNRNNSSWGNNSFGNGGSNSFGSNSSGYGSYGGGGGRSSGGRGGRGN